MRFLSFTFLFFTIFFQSYGQLTDLARVEYTYFPQRSSDNSFKRFRAFANLPLKLNDKGAYLVPGFEYRNVDFDFEDVPNFITDNLDQFNSYEATLGYTFKINEYLRFAARSGALIASNFENNTVTSDDILYSGAVFLIKDKTGEGEARKPWRLVLGLSYSTRAGRPFPLPIVNYYKKLTDRWSYGLGIPKTNFKYRINDKNILQVFATLDGFFANIQENTSVPNENGGIAEADSISMTIALSGLGYERYLTKHLVFYTYAGFTFLNDIRLRDVEEEDVYTINDTNTFYIRGGLKFKI